MLTRKKFLGLTAATLAAPMVASFGRTASAAGTIVWKSSGHGPASDPSQIYHDKLCKAITKATDGRLTVKPFVGGSIVPPYQELDAVDQGVLQMAYTCPMYNLDKWKAAGLISSRPGCLAGNALRSWFDFAGGAGLMNKMMGSGYNAMTFPGALSPLPQEVFLHSKIRLDSLKDIRGAKIRAMGDGGEILKRMGAATVIIPGGELYEAMERGTIDAFEYSCLASNWVMHFNEVAKYVYLSPSRAPSDPQVFFVNKDAWAKLPDDLKEIVQAEVSKISQDQHEYLLVESIKALDNFRKAGNTVLRVPAEIDKALLAETDKFYEEKCRTEKPIFGEIYHSMKAYGAAYANANA